MRTMRLTYPAVFTPLEDGAGYTVTVPDLPGCVTECDNLADAIIMAENAASGWILDGLEDGKKVPFSSSASDIHTEGDEFVSILALDIGSYAEKYGSKAVRKNLTIPAWLNAFGKSLNVNFSKVLQDALEDLFQQTYSQER